MVTNSWCTCAALLGSGPAAAWRFAAGRPARRAVSAYGPRCCGTFAPDLTKKKKNNSIVIFILLSNLFNNIQLHYNLDTLSFIGLLGGLCWN